MTWSKKQTLFPSTHLKISKQKINKITRDIHVSLSLSLSLARFQSSTRFFRFEIADTTNFDMSTFSGDETAPFFGFLGAAAALVFSCNPFSSIRIRFLHFQIFFVFQIVLSLNPFDLLLCSVIVFLISG